MMDVCVVVVAWSGGPGAEVEVLRTVVAVGPVEGDCGGSSLGEGSVSSVSVGSWLEEESGSTGSRVGGPGSSVVGEALS